MTPDRFKPLLDRDFLRGVLHYEFVDYQNEGLDEELRQRLANWAARELKRETQAEAAFVNRFFVETWGYRDDGTGAESFHLFPKFPIAGAGQGGNRGEADLAVGIFGGSRPGIPQVVCEFKDMKSGLDKAQNRKGNTRSPVMQARDYLWNARRGLFGNEPVQPRFAIVTDMDEFRLYWWDHFPDRYLRFKIRDGDLFNPDTLLGDGEKSQFDRFLFWRLFRPDMLLSDAGRTRLERLIERQGKAEKKLEGDFYQDYRRYREVLIANIVPHRPTGMTKGGAVEGGRARLYAPGELQSQFPKAWTYLKGFEKELRARETAKFDDDQWYRFGRHQNIDKQEVTKLLVPRLVANLGCFADERGRYYCDNVDVGGVVPARREDVWWLAGILNAPTTNSIFAWLSKPFRGDYKSANKQFIAPLPIPKANRTDRAALSALAKGMQERCTRRVELRGNLRERLGATARSTWPLERILADVRPVAEIEAGAPKSLPPRDRKSWVDEQRKADEESALARIDAIIDLESEADIVAERGKLSFRIDEQEIARAFLGEEELPLVEAQWRAVAVDFAPTGKGDAKGLIDRLRKVVAQAEPALRDQIISLGGELAKLSDVIRDDEAQLHEMTCYLFGLTDEERRLVERGR